jgi:Calpain family cysteine protease
MEDWLQERIRVIVSTQEIASHNLRDRASWAAILDCAAMKKFPDNDAADGPQFNRPKIKKGLELMTGESIQFVRPDICSDEQLVAIIQQAVVAKQPIVMASKSPQENGHIVQVVTPNHAYTIMGYDSRTKIVTLRNPYGSATPSWAPNADAGEVSNSLVRDLGQGLVQMNLGTIKYYFRYIAWPKASRL